MAVTVASTRFGYVPDSGMFRTRSGGKPVAPKHMLVGLVTLLLTGGTLFASEVPEGLKAGPATVAPHWT